MAKKKTKSKGKVEAAFREMKKNPPAILAKTRAKKGAAAAEKQRVAIGLSKARAAGAKIPKKKKKGGDGRSSVGHRWRNGKQY
jgi:hypothetical protein